MEVIENKGANLQRLLQRRLPNTEITEAGAQRTQRRETGPEGRGRWRWSRGFTIHEPIKETPPEEITYEQIRLVAAQLRRMAPALCG